MGKILLFFFAFFLGNVCAQESINTSGGNAVGIGGFVNYSVGQTVYSSYTGSNGIVSQGVQQPFEIFLLNNQNFNSFDTIVLYPNPTSSQIYLSFVEANNTFEYSLKDVTGKILVQDKISQITTIINLEDYSLGIYFLTISAFNDSKSKTFKIIKK